MTSLPLPAPFRRSDALLWFAVLVLVPLGLLMVSSASAIEGAGRLTPEVRRQALYALGGVIAMVLAARFDYRWLLPATRMLLLGTLALLGAVVAVGVAQHGAQRWLAVGEFTVQPSEFAKLTLAVTLASYASDRRPRLTAVLVSAGILGALAALVLLQPDLGTVVVLCGAWLVFLVAWGVPWRLLIALLASGTALVPLALAVAVPALTLFA